MANNVIDGQTVVAGVDGSLSSSHAAAWAADEAARRNVPLRLVHAISFAPLTYAGGLPPQEFFDAMESEGRNQLRSVAAVLRSRHPMLEIELDLRDGEPSAELIELSKSARLVVLGSRGLGGLSGMLAGSTAVALAAHGHSPVAVVRGRSLDAEPPTEGPVVVGVDGSPASEAALALAIDQASMRGVPLVAVHTWIDVPLAGVPGAAGEFIDWEAVETQEQELLAERLAGWQEKYPDVRIRRVVTRDRPVRHLLEHAANAQLLVVGSRGRGGFRGMLLGSTSQALIYHATCPLIVARPDRDA